MEVSDTKLKKQEVMIDILMGEVKRLKTELVKYKLIKELINNESENFLVERERQDREKEALVQKTLSRQIKLKK